jgi:hypothetical protein
MGYNVDYIGEFKYSSSVIGEGVLQALCGNDTRDLNEVIPNAPHSYYHIDLEMYGRSNGKGTLRWNGSEKSWIDPALLQWMGDFIRRVDPSFKWLPSRVKAVGEDGDTWFLICKEGVWTSLTEKKLFGNIGECVAALEEELDNIESEGGKVESSREILDRIRVLAGVVK